MMAQEFEVGKAPWEMENVVNEMHPNIDWMTRFKFKNFSIKPEVALEWLKKTQPNLEWKKDDSGEIVAKTPQETTWRKLDPKGFDIQDITDVIGSDVPGGITQGLATAAGALGGGRSEEHTSELQSRLHLVCRLLLEKK